MNAAFLHTHETQDCMLYMSPRMMRICVNDSLETARRKDEAYWAGRATFGHDMTPIHVQQEWQVGRSLNGSGSPPCSLKFSGSV